MQKVLFLMAALAAVLFFPGCAANNDAAKEWYGGAGRTAPAPRQSPHWKHCSSPRQPARPRVSLIIGRTDNTAQMDFEIFRTLEGALFGADDIDEDGRTEWIVAQGRELRVMDSSEKTRWVSRFPAPVTMFLIRDIDGSPGAEVIGCCQESQGSGEIVVLSCQGRTLKRMQVPLRGEHMELKWAGSMEAGKPVTLLLAVTSKNGRRGLLAYDYASARERWRYMPGLEPGPLCLSDPDSRGKKNLLIQFGPAGSCKTGRAKPRGQSQVACLSPEGAVRWNLKCGTWGLCPDYADVEGKGRKELLLFACEAGKKPCASVAVVDPDRGKVRCSFRCTDESEWIVRALYDRNTKDPEELSLQDRCLRMLDGALIRAGLQGDAWLEKGRGNICGDERPERLLADSRRGRVAISGPGARPLWEGNVPRGPVDDGAVVDLDNDGTCEFFVRTGTQIYLFRRTHHS